MSIRMLIGLGVLVMLPTTPCFAQQKLSATDRAHLVARLWSEAQHNSSRWNEVRADKDSALTASLRLAQPSQTDLRFWLGLRRLAALLGDGQAAVVAPEAVRSRWARPPLVLMSVENRPFLADYATNDELRVAHPPRLAEVLSVQGIPAEDWIRDSVLPLVGEATPAARWERAVREMLEGPKGTFLQLVLRVPGGGKSGLSVTRSVALTDRWPLERPAVEVDTLPEGAVVVRLKSLESREVVEQFDRLFPAFTGLRGLILDLRGAAGGESLYGYQILARLTGQAFVTLRRQSPQYRPGLRLFGPIDSAATWYALPVDSIAPRTDLPAYGGPIAVLSSAGTVGAVEDLLAAFRSTGRGVVIGATSAGSPGRPLELPLLKDWSLRLSVVRESFFNGPDVTGTGIAPDNPGTQTIGDLVEGRDAALELARAYLAERLH